MDTNNPLLSIDHIEGAITTRFAKGVRFFGEKHEMWEIDCVINGELEITSETEVFHCRAYEVVIHPAWYFHTSYCESSQIVEVLSVSFYVAEGDTIMPRGKHRLNKSEKALIDIIKAKIEKRPDNAITFIAEDKACLQIIRNSVESLFLSIFSRDAKPSNPKEERDAKLFSDVAYYLKTNVDAALDVEQICRDCGIGRTALKMLFTRFAGEGVMKYYNWLRVKRAMELIEQGYQMKTISEIMNFSSQYYFSDFFRRQTGVPPTKYLNHH